MTMRHIGLLQGGGSMKAFVSATLGAVLAGLILFFAQSWWSEGQASAKQRITFDRQAEVPLSTDQFEELKSKIDKYRGAVMQVMSVTNVGTEDIADKSFSIASPDMIGYSSLNLPNSNPKSVALTYDGKVFSVRYRLLPVGANHTFWIASSFPAASPEFSNDSPGIHVVTSLEKAYDEYPFPWGWIGAIAAAIMIFIVGVALGEALIANELAKRGLDYKALVKQPVNQPPSAP